MYRQSGVRVEVKGYENVEVEGVRVEVKGYENVEVEGG